MFLICGTQIAVFKECISHCDYTTKSEDKYRNLSDEERARESSQQGFFTKLHTPEMQPS